MPSFLYAKTRSCLRTVISVAQVAPAETARRSTVFFSAIDISTETRFRGRSREISADDTPRRHGRSESPRRSEDVVGMSKEAMGTNGPRN